jgi:glutamate dehydrogenase/leucine dehydrogenase
VEDKAYVDGFAKIILKDGSYTIAFDDNSNLLRKEFGIDLEMIKKEQSSGRWKNQIVTQVVKASKFYPAEDYHQDYLKKNPNGYTCHWLRD